MPVVIFGEEECKKGRGCHNASRGGGAGKKRATHQHRAHRHTQDTQTNNQYLHHLGCCSVQLPLQLSSLSSRCCLLGCLLCWRLHLHLCLLEAAIAHACLCRPQLRLQRLGNTLLVAPQALPGCETHLGQQLVTNPFCVCFERTDVGVGGTRCGALRDGGLCCLALLLLLLCRSLDSVVFLVGCGGGCVCWCMQVSVLSSSSKRRTHRTTQ